MFSLNLINPRWDLVYTIQAGSCLGEGINSRNNELLNASRSITQRFGCYCWTSDLKYYYCGSFSRDYQNHQSNLEGRVYQYLHNHHRSRNNVEPNTNLFVFQNINQVLHNEQVELKILNFDKLLLSDNEISYETFSSHSNFILAVEYLIITTFRFRNQCEWNRSR